MKTPKKTKSAPKEWHTIHVRVSNKEYETLQQIAKLEKRSTTKMAEMFLSDRIAVIDLISAEK